jgi:hypothetical protein
VSLDADDLKEVTERLLDLLEEIVRAGFEPYRSLFAPRAGWVLWVAVGTFGQHPRLSRAMWEAVDTELLPGGEDDEARDEKWIRHLAERLAKAVPRVNERALQARGKEARAGALLPFAGSVRQPDVARTWSAIIVAMCLEAASLGPPEGPALEHALTTAMDRLTELVDEEPGDETARTRVARIGAALCKCLVQEYVRAVRSAPRPSGAQRR